MSLTFNLKPGTPVHDRLLTAIFERVDFAVTELEGFYEGCRKGEEQFYAYISPPDDEAPNNIAPKTDKNRPDYQTIYIPYAYAMAMTNLTYLSTVFLARENIFQVSGRNSDSAMREQNIETYLSYQVTGGEMKPVLFNWLLDPMRFGAGIVGCYWKKDISYVSTLVEIEDVLNLRTGKKKVYVQQPFVTYQGNELYNVRPIDWFYDPRYNINELQKGEFCGEFTTVAQHVLDAGVKSGSYISENVKMLKESKKDLYGRYYKQDGSPLIGREVTANSMNFLERFKKEGKKGTKWSHDVIEFYWSLIPKDWDLSASEQLTKFYFCVSTAGVILACGPMGNMHDRYPYAAISYDIDVYKQTSRSGISVIKPVETILNWLINQHFYNVRKNLNNNSIIDPSQIVLKDLYQKNPGGYIRLAPNAYGKEPKGVIYQLQNTDITRAHLADVRMMEEFAQRIMGINDNTMGLVHPGGRKTAAEVRTSSSFATNRQKTQAEWYSCTGFARLTRQLVQNSQQYFNGEMKLKLTGPTNQLGMQELSITPEQIAGFYDFDMVDGTMPIDRIATASVLKELFMGMRQDPMLQSQYDIPGLFGYIAQLSGAGRIEKFRVQLTSPEQIQQGVANGNMVPIPGGIPGSNQPSSLPGVGNMV